VLAAWQALWAELAGRRAAASAPSASGQHHPLRFDPTVLFADYPHAYLDAGARLTLYPGWTLAAIQAAAASPLFAHSTTLLLAPDDIARVVEALARQPGLALQALAAALPGIPMRRLMRVAMLLSKLGALQVEGAALNPNKPPPLGKS